MKVEIKVNKDIKSNKENIWKIVGSFEKLADWFDGIEDTKIEKSKDGNTIRQLTFSNDAILWDELIKKGDFYYTYKIIQGDLPFENYVATVGVKENNDITTLYYSASIDVTLENKEDSIKFLETIYQDAFKNVESMVK